MLHQTDCCLAHYYSLLIATHLVLELRLQMWFYSSGRAGEKGTAYTLVTEKDKEFAGHLVRNLEGANQDVPQNLLDLAMQSAWFRKSRFKSGRGKRMNISGRGLGYRERPGLGAADSQANSGSGVIPNSIADLIPKPVRTGPGTDRLSAMKAAFRSQYVNQVRILRAGTFVWPVTKVSQLKTLISFLTLMSVQQGSVFRSCFSIIARSALHSTCL